MNQTIKKAEKAIADTIKTAIDIVETETGLKVDNVTITYDHTSKRFVPQFRMVSQ